MIRQTARPRRRASRLASVVVATALAAAGAFVAAQPASAATDGVVSVTPITQVSTYGQRVTAVALEFDGLVDPASIDPDGFRVEDTGYNFRFNSIDELDDLVDREITRAYTNSAPALRGDGSSMEGSYVVLELSDDSPGGWTVITAVNPRYVRINPDQPTQVFQLADVQGLDGSVLSTARPDAAWPLTRPAVNLEVDEFEHGVFRASTGTDVPYDFRLPEGYDPAQEYPLVVILPGHGMGSNGTNDRVQIVADIPATAWFQPEWTGTDEKVAVLAIQSVRNATEVAEAVELVRSFMGSHAIDADRVYASSVSWGSRLIWGMASTHPDLFAGALLTGGFPPTAAQITAITNARIPFWITHGTHDHLLPVANARNAYQSFVAAYQAQGLDEAAIDRLVRWTEWGDEWFSQPDFHAAAGPTYEDSSILQWLLAQDRSVDLTTGDGIEVTTQVAAGGALAMSLSATAVDLGALTMDPSLQFLAAAAELPAVTVADTRSADPGWSLTLSSADFRTSSGYTIGAEHLGLAPAVLGASEGQTVSPGATVEPGTGFADGTTLGTAPAGDGRGTATLGGALTLHAPTTTHEGEYVTWLTVTLL